MPPSTYWLRNATATTGCISVPRNLHRLLRIALHAVIMPGRAASSAAKPSAPLKPRPSSPLATPALDSPSLRYSYEIARGEVGVLSFEPYKSLVLPYWAFRTVPVARNSSETLWSIFQSYVERGDFVGADMTRKFIQMGMTRARRYANHKGGRKYSKDTGEELEKWAGGNEEDVRKRKEKEEASEVFKAVWRRCIEEAKYKALKEDWVKEKKDFVKSQK